ncbi:MAG: TRAM domain-containing protein [Tissierellia bacterium]|nr:TRAM domain-containing protein [Tissierellia bacterium]
MSILFRVVFSILGLALGFYLARRVFYLGVLDWLDIIPARIAFHVFSALLFGIIFYVVGRYVYHWTENFMMYLEREIASRPLSDLVWGIIGLLLGIIIAYLISLPLYRLNLPFVGPIASLILYFILAQVGVRVLLKRKGEISQIFSDLFETVRGNKKHESRVEGTSSLPKVLDTSTIIDGRVADVVATGFLEGPFLVPEFVLGELQHIADSGDAMKRNRGRRGLDTLKSMMENLDVEIVEEAYEKIPAIDAKLLKLSKDRNALLITTDYNLNKVATVQGITVLNVNNLANAMKPIFIAGEEITVRVVKEGAHENQGLGYLDDGTMIVIENGIQYMDQMVDCIVTSVLQTSAGKMIFAKPKEE